MKIKLKHLNELAIKELLYENRNGDGTTAYPFIRECIPYAKEMILGEVFADDIEGEAVKNGFE